MPEIKETTQTTETPKKLFELPPRNSWLKKLMVLAALIVALSAGWFGRAYIQEAEAPEAQVIPMNDRENSNAAPESVLAYYLATDNGTEEVQGSLKTRLYQYSGNSEVADVKIGDVDQKPFRIIGKHIASHKYFGVNNANDVFIFDATSGKSENLFTMESNGLLREVAVSKDGNLLAYARNYEGSGTGKSGGEIWTYNLETKEQKQLVAKTELGLYQGFSILAWRNNDAELIVSGLGGDAGATWGDLYQVNTATGALTKVNAGAEKDRMDFLRGRLSPNGNLWLYTFCAQPDTAVREKEGLPFGNACTSGTELRTYDFATKQTKKVYQNLRYDNNVDKSSLRTFMSYDWQDDATVIAFVPGQAMSIAINSGTVTELFKYDGSNPQNFVNNYKQIESATKDYVVFYSDEGWFIYNYNSRKLTSLNVSARNETVSNWLD